MNALNNDLLFHLENNPKLTKLLWLAFEAESGMDDFPDIKDKLIGGWDFAEHGQRVTITWDSPYRMETGYLFSLPGLSSNFIDSTLIHIPHTEADQDEALYFTLKHLACVASTIELEPIL